MERGMKTAAELLEICLNALTTLCLTMAAYVVFERDRLSFYALFLFFLLPFLFYFLRCRVNQSLLLFLALHTAAVAGLVWAMGFFSPTGLWRGLALLFGVGYLAASLRIRVTTKGNGEGEISPAAVLFFLLLAFLICSYVGRTEACDRIVGFALAWAAGYPLLRYLQNYRAYLRINRAIAGTMPRRDIFGTGLAAVGGYLCFSGGLLFLFTQTSVLQTLSGWIRRGLFSLLGIFVRFLSRFGREQSPGAVANQAQAAAEENVLLAAAQETPAWVTLLERLLTMTVFFLTAVGILFLAILLLRVIFQGFYGRKQENRKLVTEKYREEQERILRTKKKREKQKPFFLAAPDLRIRRAFRKTVKKAVPKETLLQKGRTARELAGADTPQWRELIVLYERARYSDTKMLKEEGKRADKLSRQILHNIE